MSSSASGIVLGGEDLALLGQDGVGRVAGQLVPVGRGSGAAERPRQGSVPAGAGAWPCPARIAPARRQTRAQSGAPRAAQSVPRPSSVAA
ncbi:hypothetical protein SR39_07275 [Methylobacterium radiotolerans]|nr:hypothetical protein SR39_07275 [Methylobacterium radiotolerans]